MIGPLKGADDACLGFEATLQQWLPLTIREEAAASGLDPLKPPADWEQLPDAQSLNTAKFPAVVVGSTGLATRPDRQGTGLYNGLWTVVVSFAVRGKSYRAVGQTVYRYAKVIRTTIMQHSDLGGVAEDTAWLEDSYAQLRPDVARSIGMGHVIFATLLDGVLDDSISPEDPDVPLNPDYPVQTDKQITLEETH